MKYAAKPRFTTTVEPDVTPSGISIFNCVTLFQDGRQVGLTTCGFAPDEVERAKADLLCGYLHQPKPKPVTP